MNKLADIIGYIMYYWVIFPIMDFIEDYCHCIAFWSRK